MATKTKRTSPTQRTLAELRKCGATVAIVERWNSFAKIRQDLFGFIDVLALLGPNIIGVQATTGSNHAARKAKILAEPRALAFVRAGGIIELHSWSETGPRGKKKTWTVRKEDIVELDFPVQVGE